MDAVLLPDPKAPSEDGVYALDYANALQDGDTVTAAAWTVPSGVTKVSASFAGISSEITIAGGTDGQDYLLVNSVTTANGLTLDGFVQLRVRQPGSQQSPVASVYASAADMMARFGETRLVELTDDAVPPTGAVNQAVLAQALADADATINGYLQSRYTLPLATVPQLLNLQACDIACYKLMRDRPTEEVRTRYEDACRWLRDVAMGKFGLGLDAEGNAVPEGNDGPETHGARRVFTRRALRDYLHPPGGLAGADY